VPAGAIGFSDCLNQCCPAILAFCGVDPAYFYRALRAERPPAVQEFLIMPSERVPCDRGARLYLGNLAMPGHASRFLGLDGIEWLLIFGTALMLGAIITLSHLFDQFVDVINSPSAKLAEFI
jgi:hypothetical protein